MATGADREKNKRNKGRKENIQDDTYIIEYSTDFQ